MLRIANLGLRGVTLVGTEQEEFWNLIALVHRKWAYQSHTRAFFHENFDHICTFIQCKILSWILFLGTKNITVKLKPRPKIIMSFSLSDWSLSGFRSGPTFKDNFTKAGMPDSPHPQNVRPWMYNQWSTLLKFRFSASCGHNSKR